MLMGNAFELQALEGIWPNNLQLPPSFACEPRIETANRQDDR
jgi:hypothetical protein